jgi:hypothetical protein
MIIDRLDCRIRAETGESRRMLEEEKRVQLDNVAREETAQKMKKLESIKSIYISQYDTIDKECL